MITNTQPIEYVKDTFPEYLGKKDHISSSDIKNFMDSPAYYYYQKYENKKVKDATARHFVVGTALHESILEPHQFFENHIVAPKFNRRTKIGKAEEQNFILTNKGKSMLLESEMEMITKMGENALKNQTLTELIKDSYRELSIYTSDEKTGLKIKLRPDVFCKKFPTIVDIKTCTSSSPRNFKGNVYSYGYSTSDAFYKDFSNKENYVFCAVEKEEPYQVALYELPDEMVEYGRKMYRTGLDLLKWSYDNNYWCSYNEFEILKECYELENLENFFDILEKSTTISILK